jgi:predicted dehydrogenase
MGVGFGVDVHVPGFQSEGWDVAALFSRDPQKGRRAADASGVPDVHTDPYELIGRDDIDAVAIATPPAPHDDYAVAALRAGKHVLCEKPFAIDARQASGMRSVAEETGRTAMVAHEFRHTPQRALIKRLLSDSYIGEFQVCNIELFMGRAVSSTPRPVTWAARKSEGGGFLGALGSHYIDGLRYWFGDVHSVTGHLATLRPDMVDPATGTPATSETDDTFSFVLTFKNGGFATMTASFATVPSRGARIAVMGSGGTLYAEQAGPNPAQDGSVMGSQGERPLAPLVTPPELTPFTDSRDPRLMAFRSLVRDFTRGIDEGTSPAPNFTDGLKCQEVLDAVRLSAAEGRTVNLD